MIAVATTVLFTGNTAAEERKPSGDNIAINKKYTLDPKPGYPYCTDPGDATQLTDGEHANGRLWTQKSTVGWKNAPLVQITVDLGSAQPIAGVSFSTAAGVAGVQWPAAIRVLASNDGKVFYDVGDLIALSKARRAPSAQGYAAHRFWTDKMATHGRFVKLLVSAGGPFVFIDELEVYRGDDVLLSQPRQGEPITDVATFFRQSQIRSATIRRISTDAEALSTLLSAVPLSEEERGRFESELSTVAAETDRLPHVDPASFQAVLPLNSLHARLFHIQAAAWRAAGSAPIMAWQSPLWDPLSLTGPLPAMMTPASVQVRMMQGEYRAAAFNLSNATDRDLTLRLRFENLPASPDPPWVRVHEVAWTDTKIGQPVASALPAAKRDGDDFLVFVPSGMTRQVWLTFHPTDIDPGQHAGDIVVRGEGSSDIRVPLKLWISPLHFPSQPTLQLGGWDYTDADRHLGVTPENRHAFIAHLREHFVDTPWATAGVIPHVPDFERLDVWLQRWPGARSYRVFLNVGSSFLGAPMGTPEFERKVAAWISAYVSHFKKRGLKPGQLGVLLVDEPSRSEQDKVIVAWARAIRAAEPEVLIWEDPTHEDPAAASTLLAACDVLCLNRPLFLAGGPAFREVFAKQRAAGRVLNFYSCSGPVQSLDPYSYHRLQAWTSWQQGATAEFFWAFGDNGGGSTWNEYATPGTNYTPLFLDDRTVTAAKHMESIREGVEDYEYLVMLRDRIAQVEHASGPSTALTIAKSLLATAADRVLGDPGAPLLRWADTKDRTVADRVRLEILDALEALETGER